MLRGCAGGSKLHSGRVQGAPDSDGRRWIPAASHDLLDWHQICLGWGEKDSCLGVSRLAAHKTFSIHFQLAKIPLDWDEEDSCLGVSTVATQKVFSVHFQFGKICLGWGEKDSSLGLSRLATHKTSSIHFELGKICLGWGEKDSCLGLSRLATHKTFSIHFQSGKICLGWGEKDSCLGVSRLATPKAFCRHLCVRTVLWWTGEIIILMTIISKVQILKKPWTHFEEHDGRQGNGLIYMYKNQTIRCILSFEQCH